MEDGSQQNGRRFLPPAVHACYSVSQLRRMPAPPLAPPPCAACTPSPNSSLIFLLKAGMSSGLRLVTRPLSVTTSLSTQFAPAFLRSVLSDGQEVTVRSRTMPASIRSQGA